MKIRDWLEPMLGTWAHQKRMVWLAIDGLTNTNILARIRDEGAGASHSSGRVFQFHPEVYTGDGLEIQRAIRGMPETPNWVLHVHWVPLLNGHQRAVRWRAKHLCDGMGTTTYFDHLNTSYVYLDGYFAGQRRAAGEVAQNEAFG